MSIFLDMIVSVVKHLYNSPIFSGVLPVGIDKHAMWF